MTKRPARTRRPQPKKSLPTIELTVTQLNDEGIGIGRHDDKEVLIAGALAGEKVVAAIEHSGQRRSIAQLRRVVKKSPLRVASPCKLAERCQGCALIHMEYSAQLRYKEAKLQQALAGYEPLKNLRPQPIWPAPSPLGYRTNAKLAMARQNGRVQIGLYRRGTHQVVDIENCPLHHPLINRIVRVVKDEIQRQKIYIYDPRTRRGLLRYLLVKISPGADKAMVTFVTAERNYREITHLGKWLTRKIPQVISVHQNINASSGNVVLGRETIRMVGVPDLIDQVGDIRLRISPTSFFQVNHQQAARIYSLVRHWAALDKDQAALDLYCGIGGIALHLAKDAASVTGIEVVEEAVRNGRENARMNNLSNCSFLAGDSAELIHDLQPGAIQAAVVNPPRSGCDTEVLKALADLAPATIIYVSCNPLTLARDLDQLHNSGYKVSEMQPVDMFPQTAHLETVVCLQRKG